MNKKEYEEAQDHNGLVSQCFGPNLTEEQSNEQNERRGFKAYENKLGSTHKSAFGWDWYK